MTKLELDKLKLYDKLKIEEDVNLYYVLPIEYANLNFTEFDAMVDELDISIGEIELTPNMYVNMIKNNEDFFVLSVYIDYELNRTYEIMYYEDILQSCIHFDYKVATLISNKCNSDTVIFFELADFTKLYDLGFNREILKNSILHIANYYSYISYADLIFDKFKGVDSFVIKEHMIHLIKNRIRLGMIDGSAFLVELLTDSHPDEVKNIIKLVIKEDKRFNYVNAYEEYFDIGDNICLNLLCETFKNDRKGLKEFCARFPVAKDIILDTIYDNKFFKVFAKAVY